MRYRLTRDDGVELDVQGAVWETVLARAYRNGWRPAGTSAPGRDARWVVADYFSARDQHVTAIDARELGAAALRSASDAKSDFDLRKVAGFACEGGFSIGRVPERTRSRNAGGGP